MKINSFWNDFENDIRTDSTFLFLNSRLDCVKNDSRKLICQGFIQKSSPKIYNNNNYICSKLSCLNTINFCNFIIRDKYLLNIYDAKNINKKYNLEEKIEYFSVEMISYHSWFSSFGYCDDTIISLGKCCKKQILEDWKVIWHKEYKRKYFIIFGEEYFYYFAILKSDKYKKYVFCFPGTTSILQLID